MRKASPLPMVSPKVAITAAQQAGNAPICSGSTTCCATTSPAAFMSAQEASWDSRTMVEKPVRNSEFCISCTMPERLALTTSRSTASTCTRDGSCITNAPNSIRHPEVLAKRASKDDGPGRASFEARLRRAPQDDGEMLARNRNHSSLLRYDQ